MYVSEAHEENIQTNLRSPSVLAVDVKHGLCMSILNLTNTGCSLTALQVGRADYIFEKGYEVGVLLNNTDTLAVKDYFSNFVNRKSPSSLRTPERNSKIRAGILNEGLVYTFYKIKFKLFAVFGSTELLRVIYNADEIVFCLTF